VGGNGSRAGMGGGRVEGCDAGTVFLLFFPCPTRNTAQARKRPDRLPCTIPCTCCRCCVLTFLVVLARCSVCSAPVRRLSPQQQQAKPLLPRMSRPGGGIELHAPSFPSSARSGSPLPTAAASSVNTSSRPRSSSAAVVATRHGASPPHPADAGTVHLHLPPSEHRNASSRPGSGSSANARPSVAIMHGVASQQPPVRGSPLPVYLPGQEGPVAVGVPSPTPSPPRFHASPTGAVSPVMFIPSASGAAAYVAPPVVVSPVASTQLHYMPGTTSGHAVVLVSPPSPMVAPVVSPSAVISSRSGVTLASRAAASNGGMLHSPPPISPSGVFSPGASVVSPVPHHAHARSASEALAPPPRSSRSPPPDGTMSSRASSRAASRAGSHANSRAGSRAASPQPSPRPDGGHLVRVQPSSSRDNGIQSVGDVGISLSKSVPAGSPTPPPAETISDGLKQSIRSGPLLSRLSSMDKTEAAQAAAREAARPQISKAERHRNLTCPRKRDPSRGSYALFSIWKFTDREFLQYGLGVMLYFKLVRRLAWLFLVMGLLNMPALVFNAHGPDGGDLLYVAVNSNAAAASSGSGGAAVSADSNSTDGSAAALSASSDASFGLALTSLANQGLSLNATIFGYSKETVGVITSSCDTFSCVVFLLALFYLVRDHRRHSAQYNSSVMTVRRFTVLVTELPAPAPGAPPLGRLQLAEWFSQFGEVVDVSMVYDDMDIVQLYKERGEMRREMINAHAQGDEEKFKKVQTQLKWHDQNLTFKQQNHRRHVRAAFITYQQQDSVARTLAAFPNSWWRRCLLRHPVLFQGKRIHVRRAAEPSNTLFPNLGLPRRDQACRRLWTGVVSLALMSVSFAAVFVSQYYQTSLPTTVSCVEAGIVTREQVVDDESLYCFCGALDTTKLLTEYSSFCSDYIWASSVAKGLIFLTAASTVLVNALLQMFMDRLARLERHGSVTSQQRGITARLFWGLWFNTGVIILLVNADVEPYFKKNLLPGRYADFDVGWFNEVGVSILITMFLNSQNPHLRSLLAIPYDACRRKHCADRAKTQLDLNILYQGRRFELAERYSILLVTVYVCMMFSAGLPLLWLVAAFTFFTTYWYDRITFLRSYRIPPRYDESLDLYAASVLPFAVVPHLLLGIWFFSSPMTHSMGLGSFVPYIGINDSAVGPVRNGVFNIRERLLQWNTFPATVLLCVLFALWLARKVLLLVFFCRASDSEQRAQALSQEEKRSRTRAVTYTEASQKVGMESYRLSKQHDFRLAYLVTESKKQLPVELDLEQLKLWEAEQIKRKNEPPRPAEDEDGSDDSSDGSGSEDESSDSSDAEDLEQLHSGNQSNAGTGRGVSVVASKYTADAPKLAKAPAPKPPKPKPAGAAGAARAKPPKPKPKAPTVTTAWGAPASQTQDMPNSASSEPRPSMVIAALQAAGQSPSAAASGGGGGDVRPGLTRKASLPTTDMHALPVAEINPAGVNDALLLSLAAGSVSNPAVAAEQLGFALLPIACPACNNNFQIVDCGQACSYTCPFCGAVTVL